jgi:hypothetical protein
VHRVTPLVVAVLVALTVTPVAAQPAACDACVRGDALIERFSLGEVRAIGDELASLPLGEPLSPEHYTRVIELRRRTPALVRLGAIDDAGLAQIASALCRAPSNACTIATTRALRCLADRCAVALPKADPGHIDMTVLPPACKQHDRRSPRPGLGFDWGTGWQRSQHPNDGHAWSLGIEGRMRITRRIGAVARVDRVAGRDEATDSENNGQDDLQTGSVVRVSALAGPSFVLDYKRFENTTRYLRLDVLGGYLATRSPASEDGPAAGFDLAYQMWSFKLGLRFVQGFGGASDTSMLLGHLGFSVGSGPEYSYDADCGREDRSSRLGLALDIPLFGYGLSSQLGYLATGLGVEAVWYLTPTFDAITRADILVFPGDERDRVLHQALLGGLRMDFGKRTERSSRNGWVTTAMAGYSHGAALTTTTVGTGPVGDLSVGWGRQGHDGAIYFRLHGRFGLSPDNSDYRVLFFSTTFELHFDPERWRDRV